MGTTCSITNEKGDKRFGYKILKRRIQLGTMLRIGGKYENGPQGVCNSVVGIATRYGLKGQGIESRWGRDFPHLSRPASYKMVTGEFPGVKVLGCGLNYPSPSSVEVKERVDLYLYSPSEPSWQAIGWNLPFRVKIMKLHITKLSPSCCYFLSLKSECSAQYPLLEHPVQWSYTIQCYLCPSPSTPSWRISL
jgi:hypothetical protein